MAGCRDVSHGFLLQCEALPLEIPWSNLDRFGGQRTAAACSWERRSTRVSMSNDSAHSPPAGRTLMGDAHRTNAILIFTAQEAVATILLRLITQLGLGLVPQFTVRALFL